jgi:hypothetical protein
MNDDTITKEQWDTVRQNFEWVLNQYKSMLGTPGVMVGPALMLTFEPLLSRYENGERSRELFEAMQNVE